MSQVPEPSMEQILASIRKIMAEEASGTQSTNTSLLGGGEDVLDLTNMVAEDGSVQDIRQQAAPANAAPAQPAFSEQVSPQPAPTVQQAPTAPLSSIESSPLPKESPADEGLVFATATETTQPSMTAKPALAAVPTDASEEDLVSGQAMAASVNAIAGLVRAAKKPTDDTLSSRSVEDLMRELLRPLLSDWLNANLPALVERVVAQEIKKLVERVES